MSQMGNSFLIEDHTQDKNRSGEGSMVALRNGEILFVYGVFEGGTDDSPAKLVQRRSKDGGLTWSERMPFLDRPAGVCNLMSVSLLRMDDGRLGCVYILKTTPSADEIMFMTSSDEGASWSSPKSMNNGDGLYYVVNNDRLAQLANGRLLAPFALHSLVAGRLDGHGRCACFISDDNGDTWRMGKQAPALRPEHIASPKIVDANGQKVFSEVLANAPVMQEPGVIELLDGRVLMWVRTNAGWAFAANSKDGGETWSDFAPLSSFAMPCGPQSIYRLPDSHRMLMLYNDRAGAPFGESKFHWRTPLAVAVSDDDARTWHRLPDLEDSTHNYCYFSACFHKENVLFSYYVSNEEKDETGNLVRANLHSLKVRVLPLSALNQNFALRKHRRNDAKRPKTFLK